MSYNEKIQTTHSKVHTYFLRAFDTESGFKEVAVVELNQNGELPLIYIPHTAFVEFRDAKHNDYAFVEYDDLKFILPPNLFELTDGSQYILTDIVKKADFDAILKEAKKYKYFDKVFNITHKNKVLEGIDNFSYYLRYKVRTFKREFPNWVNQKKKDVTNKIRSLMRIRFFRKKSYIRPGSQDDK